MFIIYLVFIKNDDLTIFHRFLPLNKTIVWNPIVVFILIRRQISFFDGYPIFQGVLNVVSFLEVLLEVHVPTLFEIYLFFTC